MAPLELTRNGGRHPGSNVLKKCGGERYDLNLWIGHLCEGAAYLPR